MISFAKKHAIFSLKLHLPMCDFPEAVQH